MGASGNLGVAGVAQNPYVQWGSTGAGAASDIFSMIQNIQAAQRQKQISDLLTNPNKLAMGASKLYGGMSGPAREAAGRDLNAQWAGSTGGAPGGAQNQFLADAFAKLEMQGYQDALTKYITSLTGAPGLPQSPMGATGGVLKSLAMLQQLRQPSEPGLVARPSESDFSPLVGP